MYSSWCPPDAHFGVYQIHTPVYTRSTHTMLLHSCRTPSVLLGVHRVYFLVYIHVHAELYPLAYTECTPWRTPSVLLGVHRVYFLAYTECTSWCTPTCTLNVLLGVHPGVH
ncbi:hypothetical protein Bca4012_063669 [Brassica carinata]